MIDGYIMRYNLIFISKSNAGWNFQWDFSESCQFTKYTKGQFYDWHCDGWDQPYHRDDPNDPSHGKIRKLSVTLLYQTLKIIKVVN